MHTSDREEEGMSKHTPGPWRAILNVSGLYLVSVPPGHLAGDFLGTEMREADARLIAAAPDAIEACRRMAEYADIVGHLELDCAGDDRCFYCAARAAIAKAEGRK